MFHWIVLFSRFVREILHSLLSLALHSTSHQQLGKDGLQTQCLTSFTCQHVCVSWGESELFSYLEGQWWEFQRKSFNFNDSRKQCCKQWFLYIYVSWVVWILCVACSEFSTSVLIASDKEKGRLSGAAN